MEILISIVLERWKSYKMVIPRFYFKCASVIYWIFLLFVYMNTAVLKTEN